MKSCLRRFSIIFILLLNGCSVSDGINSDQVNSNPQTDTNLKVLSLGDSYTKGESVCSSCGFPVQLKDSLNMRLANVIVQNQVIAQTGWTTTNLITNINNATLQNDYDLVTLLIGVNNQFQGKPFSLYEAEFPQLVNRAIAYAKGDKNRVIVLSIPDYAFTPFGQGNSAISDNIDEYNAFAQNYCNNNGITFVNITDISRLGLDVPELVAADGLHPSTLAYTRFVERLLPFAIQKIQ
ncbi:MAG: SGNH/GDSL hydrolase family protein [Bacteroidia bacterium]|nr:SGNH/GDSL hydrolase family protein [Bacteroidia bacterium]NND24472.1 SGNH/GDSL hydrolase family protein [Flavobacteriaceae bacterium]MBT8277431.1 SGNH/GDSL hydrolase family protein [Bacteroidia bacterium]NNK60807.1 SGNH/GDSL hydrolase family protein [Flavobacteriaceae bacterium]NNL32857.1 SGNH/GDSL hydrolase family protein [Flavobacteriaceae bacterium]